MIEETYFVTLATNRMKIYNMTFYYIIVIYSILVPNLHAKSILLHVN